MNLHTSLKWLTQAGVEDRTGGAGLGAVLILRDPSPIKTRLLCASLTAPKLTMQKWKSALIPWIKEKLKA